MNKTATDSVLSSGKKEEETVLLQRAQEGDQAAFSALIEPLRPRLYAIAVRLVGYSDAEDVVMDSVLKAWQALPQFTGRSSLPTWLYRIVYNCGQDHLRVRQRRREIPLEGGDADTVGAIPVVAPDPAPDHALDSREQRAAIDVALARLPELYRVALLLRYADGFSYREIAVSTGVSIGTVMSRLFNGRRRLKKLLRGAELPYADGGKGEQ